MIGHHLSYCADYRQLNAATQGDAYPLQRVDELLDRLGGSQFLTTLDLATGRPLFGWQTDQTLHLQLHIWAVSV